MSAVVAFLIFKIKDMIDSEYFSQVERDTIRKLKYVALMETKLYKNIVSEALNKFIEQWEKKNGVINLPNTKDNETTR